MFPRLPLQQNAAAAGAQEDDHPADYAYTDAAADNLMAYSSNVDDAFWADAIEDDISTMPFDASDGGLWNGRFVPPPPRPPFLENDVHSDGLTTCDLCSWAWHDKNSFSSLGDSIEQQGEIGWTFTLIIVSLISAFIGATIMIIVIKCKRLKSSNSNANRPVPWWYRSRSAANNRNSNTPCANLGSSSNSSKHPADSIRNPNSNAGVWTWLTNRRSPSAPEQLGSPQHLSPAENHYTHMDDAYSPVGAAGEALYAELDRESINSNNPSYQNTAYSQCGDMHDHDIPMVSSAPSSAYYSDLSVTAMPTERAYEIVETVMSSPLPNWVDEHPSSSTSMSHHFHHPSSSTSLSDGSSNSLNKQNLMLARRANRLSAINESTSIPSDYV
ncbi:uncharacterized protein LOC134829184 [Culicoides brevitarsis]|uniref:uncharacterized protein LOC134829184 n=1 Tax=Culicoides brevitarsis TaxID=469753 RepID=UPI00307C067B